MKGENRISSAIAALVVFLIVLCGGSSFARGMDYSGTYRCEIRGDANSTEYIRIDQNETDATVFLSWDCPSLATVDDNVMTVTLDTAGLMVLSFSQDGQPFSGTWEYYDISGTITGNKVDDSEWVQYYYDIAANGVPKFVGTDFTELEKIDRISRFRSGEGHDYSDCNESCRSMKHYYAPFDMYRENNNIEVYSPIDGVIENIQSEGSELENKQIRIRATEQPAFIFIIFHTDLISPNIAVGTPVQAGQLLGHARMYYPDMNEYAGSFDIAVWVATPSGQRYVSYFETMTASLFDEYIARGARCRCDFIISQQERDADPLTCDGERFLDSGHLENWVNLSFTNGCDFCGPDFGPPDGAVDIWDLAYLVSHWLQTECGAPNWCGGVDFDHSTMVDLVDFSTFARHWLEGVLVLIPADFNGDGRVNFDDFAFFANYWMNGNCVRPAWCNGCDINKSRVVDIYDLAEFAEYWLTGF